MDRNNRLILHRIRSEDTGRYICQKTEPNGRVSQNYLDVVLKREYRRRRHQRHYTFRWQWNHYTPPHTPKHHHHHQYKHHSHNSNRMNIPIESFLLTWTIHSNTMMKKASTCDHWSVLKQNEICLTNPLPLHLQCFNEFFLKPSTFINIPQMLFTVFINSWKKKLRIIVEFIFCSCSFFIAVNIHLIGKILNFFRLCVHFKCFPYEKFDYIFLSFEQRKISSQFTVNRIDFVCTIKCFICFIVIIFVLFCVFNRIIYNIHIVSDPYEIWIF